VGSRYSNTYLEQYWRAPYCNIGSGTVQYCSTNVECFSRFYARDVEGLKMNFQQVIGILKKSQDDGLFEHVTGHEHIKRLFRMAFESDSTTHILLTGPPASAKTTFLMSLLQHLKSTYFFDGGNTTKAGIIDYLLENKLRYLLIDET